MTTHAVSSGVRHPVVTASLPALSLIFPTEPEWITHPTNSPPSSNLSPPQPQTSTHTASCPAWTTLHVHPLYPHRWEQRHTHPHRFFPWWNKKTIRNVVSQMDHYAVFSRLHKLSFCLHLSTLQHNNKHGVVKAATQGNRSSPSKGPIQKQQAKVSTGSPVCVDPSYLHRHFDHVTFSNCRCLCVSASSSGVQ